MKAGEESFRLVLEFFKNDYTKTILWFSTKNPMLGNISPADMLLMCGEEKLLKFIQEALDKN